MINELTRLLDPLRRSLRSLIGRALVDELVRGGAVQRAQIVTEGGGALGDIEYIEPFGFTGSPPDGEHPGVYVRPNGDGSQTILICVDGRQYRLKVGEDEAAIYNSRGDYAYVKNNGQVHVKASVKVLADTPLFETTENCKIGGNLEVLGTTQLMESTTIAAGAFTCQAQANFAASANFVGTAAFTGGISANGKNIGEDHDHSGGTDTDGSTGPVR